MKDYEIQIEGAVRDARKEWSGITLIDKDLAQALLRLNTQNRPLMRAHVEMLKTLLRQGHYVFNGAAISVTSEGRLFDGQHRLTAISEEGAQVKALVVFGAHPDSLQTKTHEKPMAPWQALQALDGITNAKAVRAATQIIMHGKPRGRSLPIEEIRRGIRENPSIIDSVNYASRLRERGGSVLPLSMTSAFHYLTKQIDAERSDVFLDYLVAGRGTPTPACRLLRNLLVRDISLRRRADELLHWAYLVKAWNRADQEMEQLTYKAGGKEPYPELKK